MAILNNNPLVGASGNQGGYNINNSLRFRSSASAYLNRTPASAGNRRTWTWSAWIKLGKPSDFYALFGSTNNCFIGYGQSTGGANLGISDGNTSTMNVQTTALFRDPSAWYHFVVALDTTQATAANRVKIYVNGNQQTAFVASTYPSQNAEFNINNTTAQNIGRTWDGFQYFDGYMADINFIDGQQLTPSSFGETDTTTGVWKPKAYTGTYGTNGFYLKFSDIATTSGSNAGLGKDFSGNSNYWTTNNISVTSGTTYDAMTDSPTNTSATVANYCTLNSTIKISSGSITEGNLKGAGSDFEGWGTIAFPSTGKFYFEYTQNGSTGAGAGPATGIQGINPPDVDYGVRYHKDGRKWVNGTYSSYGATFTTNDIIGVAYDADSNSITFYKNNVSQGAISTTSGYTYLPYQFDNSGNGGFLNFGQRPFAYTPPTGFVALNTYNLPTPTILQGNKYMDATLYTQNGAASNVVVNAGQFKPDLVWIKCRSNAGTFNNLVDSVRGASKALYSNSTSAEGTDNFINTFNSNGFTLNIGDSGTNNTAGRTQVAWNWQAGQGSTSSNTSGSITSTVSVNTTAGFSIVTYTGTGANATVGHGLGVAPRFIIVKQRGTSGGGDGNWIVGSTAGIGWTGRLILNGTFANEVNSTHWNNTAPTSTVFSLGTSGNVNGNTGTYVAYCWAEIAGFSKFGSYTGNGSTDGPFVYTGFRPKWIMVKSSSYSAADTHWHMLDTSRNTANPEDKYLNANTSGAEDTYTFFDILSNGFKLRQNGASFNGSGTTYIYAAFAENPTKFALAR